MLKEQAKNKKSKLLQKNKFLVDYVWIDGYNELRSKSPRMLSKKNRIDNLLH